MDSIKVQPGQSTQTPLPGARRAASEPGMSVPRAQDSVQLNPAAGHISPAAAATPATVPAGPPAAPAGVPAPAAAPPAAQGVPETLFQEEPPAQPVDEPSVPVAPATSAAAQEAPSAPKTHSWVPDERSRLIHTPTTVKNLEKLARSVKLNENVLMTGPTGAGKTSLVKYLAHLTNNELRRINLNDMTDVVEIVGGYKPGKDGRPEWHDGVVVEALKQGQWILFDEINLAEPAILERLNSLLDDDRFLVLTEKGAGEKGPEIVRADENTRIFATMNPASYAGRKDLSAAMMNRFHKTWVEGMKPEEMVEIIQAKSKLPEKTILQMVMFHKQMADMSEHRQIGKKGGPYPFTLRDVLKWNKRVEKFATSGLSTEQILWKEAREVYQARFINDDDRKVVDDVLALTFGKANEPPTRDLDITVEEQPQQVRIGEAVLDKGEGGTLVPDESARLFNTPSTVQKLTRLAKSAALDEPVLLVGPTASGKTSYVRYLAHLDNRNLHRFNLSLQTDTSELIGGYVPATDPATGRPKPGEYAWRDGTLITAMKNGDWVVLDEINLAEPSILERLNSLLDDDRAIVLTEHDGEKVEAHPDFRVFATMNPATSQYAGRRDLSLAMRNRFTEQWFPELTDVGETTTIVAGWMKKVEGGDKIAEQMVKFHYDIRSKVESGDLASARKDGFVYTLRDLKAFSKFMKVFGPEAADNKQTFVDGAMHVYMDAISDEEERKNVEALARSFAEQL
jgi:midasin